LDVSAVGMPSTKFSVPIVDSTRSGAHKTNGGLRFMQPAMGIRRNVCLFAA